MIETASHPLAARYGVRAREYLTGHPVAIVPSHIAVTELLSVAATPHLVDDELLRYGSDHLAVLRRKRTSMFDGQVMNLVECDSERIAAGTGSYFEMIATCDLLQGEYEAAIAGDARPSAAVLPARDLADQLAGDPLRFGRGRAAAIGVSVVVTIPTPSGRSVLVGRRRDDLATDPGRLHVVPSGMLEPSRVGSPLLASVERELREELGRLWAVEVLASRLELSASSPICSGCGQRYAFGSI